MNIDPISNIAQSRGSVSPTSTDCKGPSLRGIVEATFNTLRCSPLTYADTVELLKIVEDARRDLARQIAQVNRAKVSHPFEVVYDSPRCSLEARQGALGLHEVRFTLKAQTNDESLTFSDAVDRCAELLNSEIQLLPDWPADLNHQIHMSHNWLPTFPLTADWTLTYTPVVFESGGRGRVGSDPASAHSALLETLGCTFVEWTDIHRLACGAWRIYRGFPADPNSIGTSQDQGDLMEGKIVRTAKGSESGSSVCYRMGVGSADWADDDIVSCIVVAAVPLSEPHAMQPDASCAGTDQV
jgi:hypothetical protein